MEWRTLGKATNNVGNMLWHLIHGWAVIHGAAMQFLEVLVHTRIALASGLGSWL